LDGNIIEDFEFDGITDAGVRGGNGFDKFYANRGVIEQGESCADSRCGNGGLAQRLVVVDRSRAGGSEDGAGRAAPGWSLSTTTFVCGTKPISPLAVRTPK
jgi:hypothetical protein